MIEIVYLGRDNRNTIQVRQNNVPLDFAAVTRMVLYLEGWSGTADSGVDAALIDWSQGGGLVSFALGGLDIPVGEYQASLVAFDALHPNGQVLTHAENRPANQTHFLTMRILDGE